MRILIKGLGASPICQGEAKAFCGVAPLSSASLAAAPAPRLQGRPWQGSWQVSCTAPRTPPAGSRHPQLVGKVSLSPPV